jgi:hypothetical protein
MIDNTLSWKGHIDETAPRLSQACYIMSLVKAFLSQDVLNMIDYTYFTYIHT